MGRQSAHLVRPIIDIICARHQAYVFDPIPDLLCPVDIGLVASKSCKARGDLEEGAVRYGILVEIAGIFCVKLP